MSPPIGCDTPWNYRNKMDFTFGSRRWIEPDEPEGVDADFALGLHVPGRYDKVLDVRSCDIAFAEAAPILATTRRLAREQGLTAWDVRAHTGLLRHLLVRRAHATGEILVALFTSEERPEAIDPLARALLASHPGTAKARTPPAQSPAPPTASRVVSCRCRASAKAPTTTARSAGRRPRIRSDIRW